MSCLRVRLNGLQRPGLGWAGLGWAGVITNIPLLARMTGLLLLMLSHWLCVSSYQNMSWKESTWSAFYCQKSQCSVDPVLQRCSRIFVLWILWLKTGTWIDVDIWILIEVFASAGANTGLFVRKSRLQRSEDDRRGLLPTRRSDTRGHLTNGWDLIVRQQ